MDTIDMTATITGMRAAVVQVETPDGEIYVVVVGGVAGTVQRGDVEYVMLWGYDYNKGTHIRMAVKDIVEIAG